TKPKRDWRPDVCSSDLTQPDIADLLPQAFTVPRHSENDGIVPVAKGSLANALTYQRATMGDHGFSQDALAPRRIQLVQLVVGWRQTTQFLQVHHRVDDTDEAQMIVCL